MTTDEERDRAAEARHGARIMRRQYAAGWSAEALAYAAKLLAEGKHTDGGMVYRVLAEAMFDWPIYRAALAPVVGTFAAIDPTETFEPDGPPDSYWQDADDSRYRAAMRDAGRSELLR